MKRPTLCGISFLGFLMMSCEDPPNPDSELEGGEDASMVSEDARDVWPDANSETRDAAPEFADAVSTVDAASTPDAGLPPDAGARPRTEWTPLGSFAPEPGTGQSLEELRLVYASSRVYASYLRDQSQATAPAFLGATVSLNQASSWQTLSLSAGTRIAPQLFAEPDGRAFVADCSQPSRILVFQPNGQGTAHASPCGAAYAVGGPERKLFMVSENGITSLQISSSLVPIAWSTHSEIPTGNGTYRHKLVASTSGELVASYISDLDNDLQGPSPAGDFLVVQRHDGASWQMLGSGFRTEDYAYGMAVDQNGRPCIAREDLSDSVVVECFESGQWSRVGEPAWVPRIPSASARQISLAVSSHNVLWVGIVTGPGEGFALYYHAPSARWILTPGLAAFGGSPPTYNELAIAPGPDGVMFAISTDPSVTDNPRFWRFDPN